MVAIVSYVFLQDCASRQEIQGSLKQVQKLLSAHEASYLQSLRNLKKKINLMQSSASKPTNSEEKGSLSSHLIKVFNVLHLFKSLFYRHLPKTGRTRQWEETGQVTEHRPWSPLPLWSWLWAGGFWEQGLSGEPDLEWSADVLPRWASIIGIFL